MQWLFDVYVCGSRPAPIGPSSRPASLLGNRLSFPQLLRGAQNFSAGSLSAHPVLLPSVDVLTPQREVASLRERKKAATRQALHDAVVELALAKGLDAVTVDEIADHANVSRRTFSNYFPNKEEAFLYKETERYRQLVNDVRERPPGESAWQAMVNSARHLIDTMAHVDPARLSQLRLMRRHPSLAAHLLAMQSTVERDLAEAITARCARTARSTARHAGPASAARTATAGADAPTGSGAASGSGAANSPTSVVGAAGFSGTDAVSGTDAAAGACEVGVSGADEAAMALRARVLAAVFLATLRAALTTWTENPERHPSEVLAQALQWASHRLR